MVRFFDEKDPSNATSCQVQNEPLGFVGLDDSLDLIQRELSLQQKDDTEIKVIFGFSQGAVLGHVVAALASRNDAAWACLDAVILASGLAAQHVFDPTSSYYDKDNIDLHTQHLCTLPSLHLIGRKDTFVDSQLSLALAEHFIGTPPVVAWHEKGHVVSQTKIVCDEILTFLQSLRHQGD